MSAEEPPADEAASVDPPVTRGEAADGEVAGPDLARAALLRAKQQARARGVAAGQPQARRARSARPLRPARSGDGRDPTLFGTAIRELMAERGWERTEKVASVMGRWEELVGDDVAAHCRPESLRDGELVLVAESTAWATQLRLLSRSLLARLTDELGPGVVTKVRVHGPTAPDWRKGPRRVAGRGPRDTYG